MSKKSFRLSTTAETVLALPITEALAESNKPECWSYGQIFFQRARKEEIDGNGERATAWRLLGQLSQVMLQEGNAEEPFRPISEGDHGRSILPSDLDDVTADAVAQLGKSVEDAELRARLLDIAWDYLRDSEAARQAVRAYLDSANRLFDPNHWVGYVQRIERALRLARQLNDNGLVDDVLAEIERKVIQLDGKDPLYMTSRLMELLHEFGKGDPDRMSGIANNAVQAAETARDFRRARSHLRNVARWRRVAKDKDGERAANIAIAHSYEQEADLHAADALLAAHHLERAHEAYRNIPGTRDKTDEIYAKLREAQERARDALQEFRTEGVDISELIQRTRQHVTGKSFPEALLALATVARPPNFEKETKTAQELAAQFPLQQLLGGVKMDRDGRVIAHRTPGIGGDEEQEKQALWERTVEQMNMTLQLATQGQIVPTINQLMFEHSPSLRHMRDLVVDNPFVPPGREELFARGFLAGLRWNFPEALSILVPQLENSLRHLLVQAGAEVTMRDKHGLQTVVQMGTILSEREDQLEPIFGSDIVKTLKVLFIDQHGPDLRNRIAHGLMEYGDFYSAAAIYAWWFIFFLCINPVSRRFESEHNETEHRAAEEAPG